MVFLLSIELRKCFCCHFVKWNLNPQSAEKRLTSRPVRQTNWKELRSKTLTALHIYWSISNKAFMWLIQFLQIDNLTGKNKQAVSGFETLPQSHYCHEHTAADTNSIPFSLEKTLEVLQCTSHQDLLKRGERGQVNGMVWQKITQAWKHLQVVAQVTHRHFKVFFFCCSSWVQLLFNCNPPCGVLFHSRFIANKVCMW